MKVAVYLCLLNKIGGVETFAKNLCNRTGFDFIFDTADIEELKDFKYNCYHSSRVKDRVYDVVIIASSWNGTPGNIKAKKYVQTIHADYESIKIFNGFTYKKYDVTTHHTAVGQFVANQFEKVTPYKIDKVIYNLLDGDGYLPKRPKTDKLRLISMTRLSKEKGCERILKMADMMKGVDYEWTIHGNSFDSYSKHIVNKLSEYKQIKFKGVTKEPLKELIKNDYLVQLSDTEGFSYSLYESVSMGVPVIVTDFPSAHELIKDGENGYILDMDLGNFDLNKIKKIPKITSFKEKSTENDWFTFLESIL